LAMLVVHANEPVSSDALVEALWGERPPQTAQKALHGHVSALRKLLGAERIETRAPGYLLRMEPGEFDADRFESLVDEARRTDAVHVFQEGRRLLAEEIGIDPGPLLQMLERRILVQDPALDPPRATDALPSRQERKRVTVLVAELSGPSDPEELSRLLEPALA